MAIKKTKKPVSKKKLVKKTPAKPVKKTTTAKKETKEIKSVSKVVGKITKPLSKTEIIKAIAESAGISRKEVASVFETLSKVIGLHVKGPGKFVLPGLLKIVVKKVPARPAREGRNPLTGEMMMFKAKPASKKVKALPLKSLKDMV